jgi:hypothetical protein
VLRLPHGEQVTFRVDKVDAGTRSTSRDSMDSTGAMQPTLEEPFPGSFISSLVTAHTTGLHFYVTAHTTGLQSYVAAHTTGLPCISILL